jgi:AraC-like DNA-binding protein
VGYRCQWPGGAPVFQEGLNCILNAQRSLPLLKKTRLLFRALHGRTNEMPYLESVKPQARSLADCCRHEAAFRNWFVEYTTTLKRLGIDPQPPTSVQDRRVEALMRALQEWPLDRPLSLARLVIDAALGARRVHDLLRQHLGMTAQVWLDKRRLLAARERLAIETTSFKEIAFQLGFRHPSHFTSWFKRHTHVTPTAFRAGHGSNVA